MLAAKDAWLLERIQMNQARSILKSLLPRQVRRGLRAVHRELVFRRAMRKFLASPAACVGPANPVVADLIYGWGNEPWSASDRYLAGCIQHALLSNGPILECGSGLSTILIGAVAQRRGLGYWALEHTPAWATKVKKYLDRYQIRSVVVCAGPLVNYGDFLWYRPPLESMPDSFALVVCDGPPGTTEGGRFGLAPIMKERLKPGCVILLDDAWRQPELAIARRWEAEIGTSFEIIGSSKPYIEMMVLGGGAAPESTRRS
jgi:predicted O-methyltransferase YrrM